MAEKAIGNVAAIAQIRNTLKGEAGISFSSVLGLLRIIAESIAVMLSISMFLTKVCVALKCIISPKQPHDSRFPNGDVKLTYVRKENPEITKIYTGQNLL